MALCLGTYDDPASAVLRISSCLSSSNKPPVQASGFRLLASSRLQDSGFRVLLAAMTED